MRPVGLKTRDQQSNSCKQQVIGSIPFAGSGCALAGRDLLLVDGHESMQVDQVSVGALSRYSKPGSAKAMNAAERAALIKRYKEGHRAVMDAFRGIADEELDRSASGEWTPRQIAHHLADSEMTAGVRLRRLIVEESPV